MLAQIRHQLRRTQKTGFHLLQRDRRRRATPRSKRRHLAEQLAGRSHRQNDLSAIGAVGHQTHLSGQQHRHLVAGGAGAKDHGARLDPSAPKQGEQRVGIVPGELTQKRDPGAHGRSLLECLTAKTFVYRSIVAEVPSTLPPLSSARAST